MARAAGLATPKVIRKHLVGAGRRDIDRNVATMRTAAVEAALVRVTVNIAVAPAMMKIGTAKADGADARTMTMIVGLRRDGAMAAGRATLKVIPRLRAAGGKIAVKILIL